MKRWHRIALGNLVLFVGLALHATNYTMLTIATIGMVLCYITLYIENP